VKEEREDLIKGFGFAYGARFRSTQALITITVSAAIANAGLRQNIYIR